MLPPIPQGLVPVTVQQDPARPRPEVQPVTPPSESEANRQISLDDRHPFEQEQKKHQSEDAEEDVGLQEEELPVPGKKAMARKGLLVDLRV